MLSHVGQELLSLQSGQVSEVRVSRKQNKTWHWPAFAGLMAMSVMLQGCGTLAGAGPGFSPSTADYKRAALGALRDPNTWLPALGAGVFLVSDWDQALSDWARRETPVFGSTTAASQASDVMLYASLGSALGTALWVPGGAGVAKNGEQSAQAPRIVVQLGAMAANGATTYALKYAVGRARPDASDERSFPSGHASMAFTGATLTRRNLAQMGLQDATRRALDVGFVSLAAATAWARIEAGVHYPSDVLAGAALGNFVAAFVNDAFLHGDELMQGTVRVRVLPVQRGAVLQLTRRF